MTRNSYQYIKAEKDLFAVYQTIYSQADIEMWYDWNARLNDTKWSDDCYFVYCDGEKIGGALIAPNLVMFPFLIAPYCDRRLFWKYILKHARELSYENEIQFKGMLTDDVAILMSFGVEIWRQRQIMCRPTDNLRYTLHDDFYIETPKKSDISEIANVLRKSFIDGISYRVFGEDDIEQVKTNIRDCYERYQGTNSLNQTVVVKRKANSSIVGGCIAGINPKMTNAFAGIDELFVLPEYRGEGLAETMLKHSITSAFPVTSVMKLHVLMGNPAESLYRKLGFVSGPRFTDMKYRVNTH